jgi:hypothetical protein
MMAAAYVDCRLRDPELAAAAAPVYQELYYSQYYRFHELAKLFYASNRSMDGYFWEARRLLGQQVGGSEPARRAFVRAVAGQSSAGYERMVLAQGAIPEAVDDAIAEAEDDLAGRRTFVRELGPALFDQVASVADITIGRDAVFADGSFAWGAVIASARRTEKVPVSGLVVAVLRALDGRRTLGEVADELAGGDGARRTALRAHLPVLVETLHAEGAIDLRPSSDPVR